MCFIPQKLELESAKQLQLEAHEEKVKILEAELTQVKLENSVLLKEKSQLSESITVLVSTNFLSTHVIKYNVLFCVERNTSWY